MLSHLVILCIKRITLDVLHCSLLGHPKCQQQTKTLYVARRKRIALKYALISKNCFKKKKHRFCLKSNENSRPLSREIHIYLQNMKFQ